MKSCSTCKIPKNYKDFTKRKSSKDGYNSQCKQCKKEYWDKYYNLNKTEYLIKTNDKKIVKRENNRKNLRDIFINSSCKDCGNKDIRVLEFDHLPEFEKSSNICDMVSNNSWSDIEKEIKKCEIVCANCHKIRTVERSIKNYRKVSKAHVEVALDS